jgi:hypothetical protein
MTTLNKIHLQAVLFRVIIAICLVLFFSVPEILAQKQKEDQFPFDQTEKSSTPAVTDRLFFGGSFGLSLGTITDISVSPVVGFWLLPRLAIASGPSYRYYKDPVDRTALYGGRGYLEFVVVQNLNSVVPMGVHTGLFLHLEDELLSLKTSFWKNPPPYLTDRFYVNTVLAGAGISQQLGKRSSLNFMALWPLNESNYAIYSKPVLRLSFIF